MTGKRTEEDTRWVNWLIFGFRKKNGHREVNRD